MTSRQDSDPEPSVLLVFGPQALTHDSLSFKRFVSSLQNADASWIREALASLSAVWKICELNVKLESFPDGQTCLQDLKQWLDDVNIPPSAFPLPNAVLSPLVVASHLAQFIYFVKAALPNLGDSEPFPSAFRERIETIGLCTGNLSALAVSCSATLNELQKYGAAVIKLAMLTGALVDAEDQSRPSSASAMSFSASWTSDEVQLTIQDVLAMFPEAYISVVMDEKRLTITTARPGASALIQRLKLAGAHVTEMPLLGRFHWPSHESVADLVRKLCDQDQSLKLPDATSLVFKTRLTASGDYLVSGRLHDVALRAILLERAEWYKTFQQSLTSQSANGRASVICFGSERCVPPSLGRQLGGRLFYAPEADFSDNEFAHRVLGGNSRSGLEELPDERIAVIGMACHVPGANDPEEFWNLLASGKSQHRQVPAERFDLSTAWRDVDPSTKWFGNFIADHDAFDHKFFKKSPREASSSDPQHRLALQVAYQAVQQSGYYDPSRVDERIACYMGVGNVDYEENIACYPATAYSATGNLKSFLAGKISHYFGWTGPSLTIDTACSSSSVAIHHACRAIINGEASAALAGGVNVITSPNWYHNLAGASFLSPTGQCKPFDAMADGYCRGEGVAAVFLKKLSAAESDGDQIFGVIASSRVYQNQNCTAITVPNAPSLSELFRDVVRQARIEPKLVSVVEAHGTGTPVGDPAEFEGIRGVFGGAIRCDNLQLTSVKGLVGHTECASGAVSLLKVLLMINKRAIPPQASFNSINPALGLKPEDAIQIPTRLQPWDTKFHAALINNYGASGSNASLVVTGAPRNFPKETAQKTLHGVRFPFRFTANDKSSLSSYATRFRAFLQDSFQRGTDLSLGNLSFQIARQSNPTLPESVQFSAASLSDLDQALAACENGNGSFSPSSAPTQRPVILCFGGQISQYVGLDKELYNNITVLRNHLDHCDALCISLGCGSIFPEIFQRSPIADIAKLQLLLFCMQYSCAKSWISCGIEVAAVVGHSFGELTALCISNVLSTADTMEMIFRRAKLIQTKWSIETGSMMAVESSSSDTIDNLLVQINRLSGKVLPISVACVNGPRSYTLSGPSDTIDLAAERIRLDPEFSSMKCKKLEVTHAFHSALVDAIADDLESLGNTLSFHEATIRLERATEHKTDKPLDSHYLLNHLRNPVYFSQAVDRLTKEFPTAIWLEAGSNSSVATMASRCVGSASSAHFQPINITADHSYQLLADATLRLWREGLHVSFWAHHRSQTTKYEPLILPSYQFEKSRHWMGLRKPPQAEKSSEVKPLVVETPNSFTTFLGYADDTASLAIFQVNTAFAPVQRLVEGHVMAGTAGVWPGTFQLDIVIEALMKLRPEFENGDFQPQMNGMEHYQPLIVSSATTVRLEAVRVDREGLAWTFKLISKSESGQVMTQHTSGTIVFRRNNDGSRQSEFQKLERLSGRKHCTRLLEDANVDHILRGRNIYRAFAEVIDYKEDYRHITKIVGSDNESASRVVKRHWNKTWLDTTLADCFGQTAGIYVNLMADQDDVSNRGMFICDGIKEWVRSPNFATYESLPSEWDVYAVHQRSSEKSYLSDVFAFDAQTGALVDVALGISYRKVAVPALRKMLSNVAPERPNIGPGAHPSTAPPIAQPETPIAVPPKHLEQEPTNAKVLNGSAANGNATAGHDIPGKTRGILETLCGVEPSDVHDDSDLVDMGLDSLMSMELIREVDNVFKLSLELQQLMNLTDFTSLVECIRQSLGVPTAERGGSDDHPQAEADDIKTSPPVDGLNGTSNGKTQVPHVNGFTQPSPSTRDLLSSSIVREAFQEVKDATDDFILNGKLHNYYNEVMPRSTELCIAHICNAFEKLGCPIRTAAPGDRLERISYLPRHEQQVELLYGLLETEAHLIEVRGTEIIRTATSCPSKPTASMLNELLHDEPIHAPEHKLTELIGEKFADCLSGKEDGLQLVFGSAQGREIVTDVYAKSPINAVWIEQAQYFIQRLASRLPRNGEPLRILEMGAGTGGTTVKMLPMLSQLGIPIEYTMTDLSSSLVAAGRKRFRQYPFMKFKPLNIETEPDADLLQSQHIILATNCVHATRNLTISTSNIRKILKPDGFLLLLEMTEQVPWVDFIFGLIEGWWLFEDGRRHALQPPQHWDKILRSVGYGHVDWTEGQRPEARIQRLIIALASGERYDRVLNRTTSPPEPTLTDVAGRRTAIEAYVSTYADGFAFTPGSVDPKKANHRGKHVLVTGATGSLGCHIVLHHAKQPDVDRVICLNRISQADAEARQFDAFAAKGMLVDPGIASKLEVIETDTSKPLLGLSAAVYTRLSNDLTHIVHNAWPMSIKRPIKGYESQFRVMRNLIDLASIATSGRPRPFKFGFQLISSIGVMGCYPLWKNISLAPEERTTVESVLPVGYADAKLVCEHLLDKTLHKYPDHFRSHSVRIGQIAGSTVSGYWNPTEHLVLLLTTSRTIRALPDLDGTLSWCPVDKVAEVLGDLIFGEHAAHPIYHIENPVRQSYKSMIAVLARELGIRSTAIVPFEEWIDRVRRFPGSISDCPAKRLLDFFEADFLRMSCGALVLDTKKCQEDSPSLRRVGPVSIELAIQYVCEWKRIGLFA